MCWADANHCTNCSGANLNSPFDELLPLLPKQTYMCCNEMKSALICICQQAFSHSWFAQFLSCYLMLIELDTSPLPGKGSWLPRRYIFACWDSWQPSCRKSCLCWWWDIRQPQVLKPSCSHAGHWNRPTNIPKFRLCVVVRRRPAEACGWRAPRRCPSFLCRLLRLIEHLPTLIKNPLELGRNDDNHHKWKMKTLSRRFDSPYATSELFLALISN